MPNAYLSFDGNCKQAFDFYAETLGGKVLSVFTYGNSPMAADMPPNAKDLVMHASMSLGDKVLMGADCGPWSPYEGPMRSCSLSLHPSSVEQGQQWFDALSAGGTVKMPYQKTFWAAGFGMLVDKFGVAWMVNVEAPSAG